MPTWKIAPQGEYKCNILLLVTLSLLLLLTLTQLVYMNKGADVFKEMLIIYDIVNGCPDQLLPETAESGFQTTCPTPTPADSAVHTLRSDRPW